MDWREIYKKKNLIFTRALEVKFQIPANGYMNSYYFIIESTEPGPEKIYGTVIGRASFENYRPKPGLAREQYWFKQIASHPRISETGHSQTVEPTEQVDWTFNH